MSVIQIKTKDSSTESRPFLSIGFRPFFLGAALFAIISMAWWMAVYVFHLPFPTGSIPPQLWHAHEMIYGYSSAVIAGFLLTAVTNWTGRQTAQGLGLARLFFLWVSARLILLSGTTFWMIAAVCDLLFFLSLCIAIASPIIASKQWKQIGIVSKVLLLFVGNGLFYLALAGFLPRGAEWSIYGGLYLIISLILTIAGRVLPGFIENGVSEDTHLRNPRGLSIATLAVFLVFFVNQLFFANSSALLISAGILCALTTCRLAMWHTKGIWRHPLLWSVYLAIVWIDVGFFLFILNAIGMISHFLAIHAFASGGIGFATLGMMARVTLGHTGRSVHAPPPSTVWACYAMSCAVVFRVIFPIFEPARYGIWIAVAQFFWMAAFAIFLAGYAAFLVSSTKEGVVSAPFTRSPLQKRYQ